MKRSLLFILTVFVLTACGGSGNNSDSSDESNMDPVLQRVSNPGCLAADVNNGSGVLSLEASFPNLPGLPGLLGLFQAPGDSSLWYALLREGRVVTFTNTSAVASYEEFLDISNEVRGGGEMGLLGFAFHPQFAVNGEFFVSYNDDNSDGDSTISRFTFTGSSPVSLTTEEVILTLPQPASNHNGGAIGFGPDGYLYIGFGDGGGANDTFNHGQNTLSWHAAILRIDVDSASPYTVPADNPFLNDNNFLPEIYAWGLRNPWRWSFDSQNGDLWVADVGQSQIEEVNLVSRGDNLGWPIMEGSECFASNSCDSSALTLPVAEYFHEDGDCSVTGGYVYRSARLSALQGSYFFADFCTGRIRRTTELSAGLWDTQEVMVAGRNIAAFGQGNDGEVYVLDIAGAAGEGVFHFTAASGGNDSPAELLSQTGCFSSTADKTVANGVVPYSVSSPLWSDGAEKERFFAIPDGTNIAVLDDGDFEFPRGSVLVKHFLDGGDYLETRLFMHHQSGWRGYSYEWQQDGNDAVLLTEGKVVDTGNLVHTFPSSDECLSCHTGAANHALGLEASQLNNEIPYPSGTIAHQLDALTDAGFLSHRPLANEISALPGLDDGSATFAERARGYLHSNCSGCHRPGAPGALIDLRVQTLLADMGICDQPPATDSLGIADARIIAPGDPERSVLLARMRDLGDARMPPLASLVVDNAAVEVIEQWVSGLTACD